MIKPGTLCIIVRHSWAYHVIGQEVTFLRYGLDPGFSPSTKDDCMIHVPDDKIYSFPSAWLLPIQPDPDMTLQFECEREHA